MLVRQSYARPAGTVGVALGLALVELAASLETLAQAGIEPLGEWVGYVGLAVDGAGGFP